MWGGTSDVGGADFNDPAGWRTSVVNQPPRMVASSTYTAWQSDRDEADDLTIRPPDEDVEAVAISDDRGYGVQFVT